MFEVRLPKGVRHSIADNGKDIFEVCCLKSDHDFKVKDFPPAYTILICIYSFQVNYICETKDIVNSQRSPH